MYLNIITGGNSNCCHIVDTKGSYLVTCRRRVMWRCNGWALLLYFHSRLMSAQLLKFCSTEHTSHLYKWLRSSLRHPMHSSAKGCEYSQMCTYHSLFTQNINFDFSQQCWVQRGVQVHGYQIGPKNRQSLYRLQPWI